MYCNSILMYFILFIGVGWVLKLFWGFGFFKAFLQDTSECRLYSKRQRKIKAYICSQEELQSGLAVCNLTKELSSFARDLLCYPDMENVMCGLEFV